MTIFDSLSNIVNSNMIEPYLRYIRFPRFKNLSDGLRINFDYPITALLGPNGTNKSSILRAIEACPSNKDIGDHWFDTALDRISGLDGDKNPDRYIHGYKTPSGHMAEVVKTRVWKKSRGADYFETRAPLKRDGMQDMPFPPVTLDENLRNKTRWRPINKDVVYLDFRQELPAYDILMSFNWRDRDNSTDWKKRRIRAGGPHIRNAFKSPNATHVWHGKNRILEPAIDLTAQELEDIGKILQREYSRIQLVKHEYFGVRGYTASLTTPHRGYSEAYAGSGEFAAIMLVKAISRAGTGSLILLDEPETSLHPGAQRELMRYIARQCVSKKLQVIVATHAPSIVEELPNAARKLLDIQPVTGRVELISQSASLDESFSRVGALYTSRTIIVEDELAKEFILRAARVRGKDFMNSINVVAVPGGAQTLAGRVVPVEAQLGSSCSLMLDGDQRPESPRVGPKPPGEVGDGALGPELLHFKITDKNLLRNGGNDNGQILKIEAQRKTYEWAYNHVGYLPSFMDPDSLLWSISKFPSGLVNSGKDHWREKTIKELGKLSSELVTSVEILNFQKTSLASLDDDHPVLLSILDELDRLLD
ncbi:AAA family ATPase [Glutamicibacter protophormiae]|uniref:ATP-dependent nuclease n=1 Tax=Glutamicibacter protophormiae TaxID=37930 RepID=UPI002A7FFD2F|nr:AAA family ATPase [Glutamicibacter protophormiae]WPR64384.1 AAA family ATPase [Glutamicibacter protophormiae]WPR67877.1 AAA family ATPase [Glutamicibacter protophormiae]